MYNCPSELMFELNGELLSSSSSMQLSDIGEVDSALIFRTDHIDCCRVQKIGECYRLDGELVGVRAVRDQLYRNRREQLLRLNCQSFTKEAAVSGLYCCEVPKSQTDSEKVCALGFRKGIENSYYIAMLIHQLNIPGSFPLCFYCQTTNHVATNGIATQKV